jgi:ADP-ribose pyrophosphatase
MPKKTTSQVAKKTKTLASAKKGDLRQARTGGGATANVQVISSQLSYQGPLFNVFTDEVLEDGKTHRRDVIRHPGSIVILAVDDSKSKRDPLIVIERQYRHAARQYLLEVPAGKLEEGEDLLAGAKRELLEETGFRAKRWRKVARYFASPGFLGEWMQLFLAEGLTAGTAMPEEDESIEVRMIALSKLLSMIQRGEIHDGKTLIAVLLYDRLRQTKATNSRK